MTQTDKKVCLSPPVAQETDIIQLTFIAYMCKIIVSRSICFQFFKIFVFCVPRGVKGQKMVQNDIKFYLSHLIFQESYITWSSFMVNMFKRIIFPGIFFIFKKFWFSASLGEGGGGIKGQEMAWNYKNSCLISHLISGIVVFGTHEWNGDISSNLFFIFSKFSFFWFLGE